jgi:hypothetical protein
MRHSELSLRLAWKVVGMTMPTSTNKIRFKVD